LLDIINTLNTIPPSRIEPLYHVQETLCMLLIIFLILISIIEIKFLTKILLSIFAGAIIIMHYYVIHVVASYEKILFLPFLILETSNNYSAISIDYGQLLILVIILMWRKELVIHINKILLKRSG